jgi:hypothetical protein
VARLWESEYGWVATLEVTGLSNVRGSVGENEPPVEIIIGDVANLGLGYAALRDAVNADHLGHTIHVAFTEWGKTKKGQKFRQFVVFDLGDAGGGPPAEPPAEAQAECITKAQAAELWLAAQDIDWGDETPEAGLRRIVGLVRQIEPDSVRFSEITVDELPIVQANLAVLPKKTEDTLPF